MQKNIPVPWTVANEGLGWESLSLKNCKIILVVTGRVRDEPKLQIKQPTDDIALVLEDYPP